MHVPKIAVRFLVSLPLLQEAGGDVDPIDGPVQQHKRLQDASVIRSGNLCLAVAQCQPPSQAQPSADAAQSMAQALAAGAAAAAAVCCCRSCCCSRLIWRSWRELSCCRVSTAPSCRLATHGWCPPGTSAPSWTASRPAGRPACTWAQGGCSRPPECLAVAATCTRSATRLALGLTTMRGSLPPEGQAATDCSLLACTAMAPHCQRTSDCVSWRLASKAKGSTCPCCLWLLPSLLAGWQSGRGLVVGLALSERQSAIGAERRQATALSWWAQSTPAVLVIRRSWQLRAQAPGTSGCDRPSARA